MWYVKIWDSQRIRKKFQLRRRKNEIAILFVSIEMDIHTHISIPATFISHRFSSPTQTLSSSSFSSYFPFKFVVCSKRDDQSQRNADNNGICSLNSIMIYESISSFYMIPVYFFTNLFKIYTFNIIVIRWFGYNLLCKKNRIIDQETKYSV